MTTETISDLKSNIPLSPASLLTIKPKVMLPHPGYFLSADIYCQKHWSRTKNTVKTRKESFWNGNIVLLKYETHPNHWPVASMIEIFLDKHGVVQTDSLNLESENNAQRQLVRPIANIVFLVEDDYTTESQRLNQN